MPYPEVREGERVERKRTQSLREKLPGDFCDSLINSLALMLKIQGAHSPFGALRTRTENTQACLPAHPPAHPPA